jgi:putative DNA primase/helicase
MNAEAIARSLGGITRSGTWWRCRCPVHHGQSSSLALRHRGEKLIVHCHAGCSSHEVLAELIYRGLLAADGEHPQQGPERDVVHEDKIDRLRRIALARDMWSETVPADTTPQIGRYLQGRGITIAVPPTIRLMLPCGPYGRHPYSGEHRPQMIGVVEHVEFGVVAVSRTFLAMDGSCKATLDPPRLFCGPAKGGAIRLANPIPNEWLIIGEGIESTASAMQLSGLPGWAALSAGGIENLILPPAVNKIIVAADNDLNGRGEWGARIAATRWLGEGRRVQMAIPPIPGTDFNNILLGGE